jgi:uncharacterized SAM-binding protein YcdF (DUF218 family)
MLFFLKKWISAWLLPLPAGLALLVVGLGLLWFSKRQLLGRLTVSAGTCLLLVSGYGLLASVALDPLEAAQEPLSAADVLALRPPPTAIVVLGAGYLPEGGLPANDRLGTAGLARVVEAVRLWRIVPRAELVLSNGFGQGQAMSEAATFLGVPPGRIVLEQTAMDTEDEAGAIKAALADHQPLAEPFLLVTSGVHMRRAEALCRARGLHPIAAPTDYLMNRGPLSVFTLVPSTGNLMRVDNALHEWTGLLWAHLRGAL